MKYYNLIFAVFYLWRLAITTFDKQSCFYYNVCGFSAERWFGYNIPIKFIMLSLKRIHWKWKLWVVWLRNFEGSNLTFDLQRSTQVKIDLLFESPYIIVPYLLSINTFYLELFFRRSTSKSSFTLSLYLVPFSRYSTSKFLGFDLGPSEVTWGQNCIHHSRAHTWFTI